MDKSMLALVGSVLIFVSSASAQQSLAPPPVQKASAAEQPTFSANTAPLAFEPNRGQFNSSVRYFARADNYAVFLSERETVFVLHTGRDAQKSVLRLRLEGAGTSPHFQVEDRLAGQSNYIIGGNPGSWRTLVPHFGRVLEKGTYPGIDIAFHATQRQLEYDFVVAPQADPSRIKLHVIGASRLHIDQSGKLRIAVGTAQIFLNRPMAFQVVGGRRRQVAISYCTHRNGRVTFLLGRYDRSQPLVIDPVVGYASYLGGSGTDVGEGVAVDLSGNVYIAGYTFSTDFPTSTGAAQTKCGNNCASNRDAFITKISSSGTLEYSTYLGGSGDDQANGIAVDAFGNAYLTGHTSSVDFPLVNPFDSSCTPCATYGQVAFVAELNSSGSALVYSSYLGGNGTGSNGQAIAVDSSRNAYVTGTATSGFPTTAGAYQTIPDEGPFLSKISSDGSALVYSTMFGQCCADTAYGVAVDSFGEALITGFGQAIPTTPGAYMPCSSTTGFYNAFVSKFNSSGSALAFSTCLGGSADDLAYRIALDPSGNVWITGRTDSIDFPVTAGAFQNKLASSGGSNDAFVSEFDSTGSKLLYSTYLGGSSDDQGGALTIDSGGNVYAAGGTSSSDFPLVNAFQPTLLNGQSGYLTKFLPDGSVAYSSYVPASYVFGLAVSTNGAVYMTGQTSAILPNLPGAFQASFGGQLDAYLEIVGDPKAAITPQNVAFGSQLVSVPSATQSVSVVNGGNVPLMINSIATTGDFTQTNTCVPTVPAGKDCVVSLTFVPTVGGPRTGTLTLTDSAADSPQVVSLTGSGADYALSLSVASLSLNAGQSGTATATISPVGGFNEPVSLGCTGAPAGSTCSVSPASVTPSGSSTLTITTTAPSLFVPVPPRGLWPLSLLCLLLLVLIVVMVRQRRLRLAYVFGALICALFAGCGGGGGPHNPGTPAGTYTITVTGSANQLQHSTTLTLTVQ